MNFRNINIIVICILSCSIYLGCTSEKSTPSNPTKENTARPFLEESPAGNETTNNTNAVQQGTEDKAVESTSSEQRELTQEEKDFLLAIRPRNMEAISDYLSNGGDINVSASLGTALMLASQFCDVQIFNTLIDAGAEVNVRNGRGHTTLTTALRNCRTTTIKQIARTLINKDPSIVNFEESSGKTALMIASAHRDIERDVELIQMLIDVGADVEAQTNDGLTALMVASGLGHIKSTQMLIDAGAKIETRAENGQTALLFACSGLNPPYSSVSRRYYYKYKTEHIDVIKALLQNNADVNARDNEGWACLMLVYDRYRANRRNRSLLDTGLTLGQLPSERAIQITKELLENGADPNIRSNSGVTPLMLAVSAVSGESFVKMLIEHRADSNAQTNDNTASPAICSHHGTFVSSIGVREALQEAGADFNDIVPGCFNYNLQCFFFNVGNSTDCPLEGIPKLVSFLDL